MGNTNVILNTTVIPNADNSQSTSYLYEITHDIITNDFDRKQTVFFTNILGVLCYLEFSKHNEDDNIKLIVYRNELNLYHLDDDQIGMMLTVFPSLDEEFVPKDESVSLCKELHKLTLNKLKIEEVNDINKIYGSYLYVNKNRLSVCEHIKVDSVYDLNVSQISENDKTSLQNLSEKDKIKYLLAQKKINQNPKDTVKVENHLDKITKKEKEKKEKKEKDAVDGKRKKSLRKRSKKKKSLRKKRSK
jgi:hypothetical protein